MLTVTGKTAACLGLLLVLAGCGGTSDAGTSSSTPAAAASASSASPAAASAPAASAVSAAELCRTLTTVQPKLDQQPGIAAMVTLTTTIAGLYDSHDALATLGAADLDGMTTKECPAARTAALKAAGVAAFAAL